MSVVDSDLDSGLYVVDLVLFDLEAVFVVLVVVSHSICSGFWSSHSRSFDLCRSYYLVRPLHVADVVLAVLDRLVGLYCCFPWFGSVLASLGCLGDWRLKSIFGVLTYLMLLVVTGNRSPLRIA